MKVMIVKKGMRDRVVMPRVETRWEKAALQLPKKNHVTGGDDFGPDRPIMKLCGIILQVVASVWGSDGAI